jgi:hypothetical protein
MIKLNQALCPSSFPLFREPCKCGAICCAAPPTFYYIVYHAPLRPHDSARLGHRISSTGISMRLDMFEHPQILLRRWV